MAKQTKHQIPHRLLLKINPDICKICPTFKNKLMCSRVRRVIINIFAYTNRKPASAQKLPDKELLTGSLLKS